MSIYTLSLNCVNHDSSLAVFKDDKVIFFHKAERSSRIKHDYSFDLDIINYIKNKIVKDIDILIIGSQPTSVVDHIYRSFKIKKTVLLKNLSSECQKLIEKNKLENFTHHSSHAMSGFYMSPFDEAVCLVADAVGESFTFPTEDAIKQNKLGKPNMHVYGIRGHETTSIFEINKNYRIKSLYKRSQAFPVLLHDVKSLGVIPISHIGAGLHHYGNPLKRFKKFNFVSDMSQHSDIGIMYQTISMHLNFGVDGSGKVMGLSAYGENDPALPPFLAGDTIYANSNLFLMGRELNYHLHPELFTDLSFQKKANLAYSMQRTLEKAFLHHAEFIKQNSKIRNLVIGGGCALNILGISLIKQHYPEFNIYVDPIADDATHAIGQGIHFYNLLAANCNSQKANVFNSIYLGPEYQTTQMIRDIDEYMAQFNN